MKSESDNWYFEKYRDTICVITASNISAYKTVPSKDVITTVTHSAYFQTVKNLKERGFIKKKKTSEGGFIASVILNEEDEESEIGVERDYTVLRKLAQTVSFLIVLVILLKLLKR